MSGAIEEKDMTGEPRSTQAIVAALLCISEEIGRNPMALSKRGELLIFHYVVIRDVLLDALKARANKERPVDGET